MSFSTDVKQEILDDLPDKPCCRAAQAYGMLEFGHAFGVREISIQTEFDAVAEQYASLTASVCGVPAPTVGEIRRRTVLHTRSYADTATRERILDRFGHSAGDVSVRLNRANLDCDNCARALLRGAFLSCGTITDPNHNYHLEFVVPHYNLSRDLIALLGEVGFSAKVVTRNGSYVVYIKESERIEDCLTYLGASHGALEMMSVKVIKSIRNETNRRLNCDSANIDRTVAAAGEQLDAVRRIENTCGINALPDNLQPLARLRLENPDMSLRELGAAMEPPLSRSGVHHRMQRILEFAARL